MQAATLPNGNMVLDALAPACRHFLEERSLTKPIASGEVLHETGARLQDLIFLHEGLVSLQYRTTDHRTAEIMPVGTEGAVGVGFLLGRDHLPYCTVTVISGRATWVPVRDIAEALGTFPCARPALQNYVAMMMQQLMQSAACASLHNAIQRLSTWLLHADDRAQTPNFDITQRILADILGFRLATISDSCHKLLEAGAIDYSRGNLKVVDRNVLKEKACECYAASRLSRLLAHEEG